MSLEEGEAALGAVVLARTGHALVGAAAAELFADGAALVEAVLPQLFFEFLGTPHTKDLRALAAEDLGGEEERREGEGEEEGGEEGGKETFADVSTRYATALHSRTQPYTALHSLTQPVHSPYTQLHMYLLFPHVPASMARHAAGDGGDAVAGEFLQALLPTVVLAGQGDTWVSKPYNISLNQYNISYK